MRMKVISCVICAIMISTILVIEIPEDVSGQVTEEWVARYNLVQNDYAYALAVDESSGNVYVTGSSGTVAYNSSGHELWIRGGYEGRDIAVSTSSGYIYVTGTSFSYGTGYDLITIKYDPSGNELWTKMYNTPGNGDDKARALALASYENIFVTGYSDGAGNDDYLTVSYDSLGNLRWMASYNGPGNDGDWAKAISIDSSGNAFITGTSYGTDTKQDIATIMYDPLGNELWVARYNGPANYDDYSRDLALDSSGNVYVTGSGGKYPEFYYATIAYDSSGKQLWVASYNGPVNGQDHAQKIAVDPLGNVYVTGEIEIGPTHDWDFATIKYDSLGNELWVVRYNGPGNGSDQPSAMSIDTYGNIYVSGYSWSTSTWPARAAIATVVYDSMGNELWTSRYCGPGDSGWDTPEDIVIDSSGNVYVTGKSYGDKTGSDYVTIKYSQPEPILEATIDIDPDTLNLKSKGRWITCYINLNSPFDVNDIDINTVILEDTIPAEWGDIQNETLMVKFDRSDVEDMFPVGTYNMKVTGELVDGTSFEGYSDEIRVIDPGK